VTYEEVLLVEEMLLVEATELLITELEILELELDVGLDEDKLDEDKLDERSLRWCRLTRPGNTPSRAMNFWLNMAAQQAMKTAICLSL
jgi:hypothetical protein